MPRKVAFSGQISWVYTNNLDDTAHFYSELLQLELVRDEGSARIYRTCESSFIGVCTVFADRVVQPAGGMITLLDNDVDERYRLLKARGVRLSGRPKVLDAFGIYSFFAFDPNDYVIEFQKFLDSE